MIIKGGIIADIFYIEDKIYEAFLKKKGGRGSSPL